MPLRVGPPPSTSPLALVHFQLVDANSLPVSGATVTLTSTSCPADPAFYNLPTTDGNGETMSSVPYGKRFATP